MDERKHDGPGEDRGPDLDEGPDLAHTDAQDGMIGTPTGGNVGETPRGWAAYGAARHLPDGLAERGKRKR